MPLKKKKYHYDYNGFDVAENRRVSFYYMDYSELLNYVYIDLWLNWNGSFERPDQTKGNYLYEWRGMNHYLRDRNALFEGR